VGGNLLRFVPEGLVLGLQASLVRLPAPEAPCSRLARRAPAASIGVTFIGFRSHRSAKLLEDAREVMQVLVS